MKILVQPGGDDRRVPWPPLNRKAPRYFPQGTPSAVELDGYIQRRLDCGDLVQVEETAAPTPAPAQARPAASTAQPAATATKAEG